MPTTKAKNSFQRATVRDLVGAGGEPPGEPPAPPPGLASAARALSGDRVSAMLERPVLGEGSVQDAIDRARLRGMVEAPDGIPLSDEVIDELLAGARTEEEIAGPGGLLAAADQAAGGAGDGGRADRPSRLRAAQEPPGGAGNTRNGTTPKTLITEHGPVAIDAPRDRDGSFEPQIVRKRQRRFEGFDDKILALYSAGSRRATSRRTCEEIYGVKVGRDLISRVTDAVMDDVRAWAERPLEDVYPIVFLDALVLKIREGGSVQRRACYLALGVDLDGDRDVLGMWFQETEGAKFWMQVLNELKQRGVQDILIGCVDGLKGFPEAIEAIFPQTTVQTCIVHLIRNSLNYVPRREREQVARDLKPIYTAVDADHAQPALEALRREVGRAVPGDHPGVAGRLGVRDPVPRVPAPRSAA